MFEHGKAVNSRNNSGNVEFEFHKKGSEILFYDELVIYLKEISVNLLSSLLLPMFELCLSCVVITHAFNCIGRVCQLIVG